MTISVDLATRLGIALANNNAGAELAAILNGTQGAATTFSGGLTVTTSNVTITDVNLVLSTVTGTQIGTGSTQKLGFYGATAIVQPAGSTDVLTGLINLGLRASGANPPLNIGTGAITAGNLTLSGVLNDSAAGAVSAAGTTQAGATALTLDVNNVSTVGANSGVALPTATAGRCVTVINSGANALSIYPVNAGTDQINALGANNPTLVPVGQLAVFECAVAGTWSTLVTTPRQVKTALNSVGAGTLTAAGIIGGLTVRGGAQSNTNFTDTSDTVANLIAGLHGAAVGQSWEWTYQNTTNAVATIAGASSVTVSGITVVPPGTWANFLVTFATATTFTVVGYSAGPNVAALPSARTTSAPTNATATMSSGVLSDLTLEVAAGQKVAGSLFLIAKNSTGSEGLQIDFNGGTATMTSVFFGFVATPVGATLGVKTSAALGTALTATTVDTNDEVYQVYFEAVVNAAGTIIPRFGEVSHTTGTATVEIGSTFTLNTTSN